MKRILLESVPSTNDYALDLAARERPAEHTVVQTLEQTRGRGQAGARWHSERGKNLTVSVILYPGFLDPRRQFLLTQAMALAVAETVDTLVPGSTARIKWPNDVLRDGLKVAGILIECRVAGDRLDTAVVGVGLNVNQTVFPPDLAQAGSLARAAGRELDLEHALAVLHERIDARYIELRASPGAIESAYRTRLYALGERRVFATGSGRLIGVITGVDAEGRLLFAGDDGASHAWGTKEIALVEGGSP